MDTSLDFTITKIFIQLFSFHSESLFLLTDFGETSFVSCMKCQKIIKTYKSQENCLFIFEVVSWKRS